MSSETPDGCGPELDQLASLIRERRSHLLMDRDRPVPFEVIELLCELATWAPNHKRTWPWRVAVFTGAGRTRLGEAFADEMARHDIGDDRRRNKTAMKYCRAPAVLVVGSAAHDDPVYHAENRDAVAAGIQNVLLGATAAGLASFWSSPPVADSGGALAAVCNFELDDRVIGVIYLGWPTSTVEPPARPAPTVFYDSGK